MWHMVPRGYRLPYRRQGGLESSPLTLTAVNKYDDAPGRVERQRIVIQDLILP